MDACGGVMYKEGFIFVFYPQAGGEVCIVYTVTGDFVEEELVDCEH